MRQMKDDDGRRIRKRTGKASKSSGVLYTDVKGGWGVRSKHTIPPPPFHLTPLFRFPTGKEGVLTEPNRKSTAE